MDTVKLPIRQYWNRRSTTYGLDRVLNELLADTPDRRALDAGTGQFAVTSPRSATKSPASTSPRR